MARQSAQRYADMQEMADDLRAYLEHHVNSQACGLRPFHRRTQCEGHGSRGEMERGHCVHRQQLPNAPPTAGSGFRRSSVSCRSAATRTPACGELAHLQTGEPAERGTDGRILVTGEMGLVFVLLPAGTFTMGAQASDPAGPNYDPHAVFEEGPPTQATLPPFFLSKYEWTQGPPLPISPWIV
jgi:hypothetical protein